MTESFGARLRQQRERQQIALTDIADRTKINRSLLDGLERDDLSNWPGGIFRRSFIRAYAQAIGLEPGSIVREFLELYPDPAEEVDAVSPATEGESFSQRPPTRLSCLIDSAISSLRRSRVLAVQESVLTVPGNVQAAVETVQTGEETSECLSVETPTFKSEPDLSDVAQLCTELCRVLETREVTPLLKHVAEMLDAIGLIVWVWDPQRTALKPALAHGYSDEVLASLPRVRRDTDNATAASFRSAQTHIVNGKDLASGAVVVPLMTPAGCTGVFAVELRHGGEQRESVRALATIFAAQLATFVGSAPLAEAVNA